MARSTLNTKPQPAQSSWYVYMMECSDNKIYTGMTKNLDEQVAKHHCGHTVMPVMFTAWQYARRSDAAKAIHASKKLTREEQLQLLYLTSSFE